MRKKELFSALCEEAYPTDKDGKRHMGRKAKPLACAECESPCMWGLELLRTLDEKAFRELLCGSDCKTCMQPCNLRRVVLIRSVELSKGKKQKGWMQVALRPYGKGAKKDV